ncbi:MAG: hypothetical protein V1736_13950 [Pseudomonadota bacterium]
MKVPCLIVPVLIALLSAGGVFASKLFSVPSVVLNFEADKGRAAEPSERVSFLVDGIRCYHTARMAGLSLKGSPGIVRYAGYASDGRVEVTYNPKLITIDKIRRTMEGPVYNDETQEFIFNYFRIIAVDKHGPQR